jgi:hypothetical protein
VPILGAKRVMFDEESFKYPDIQIHLRVKYWAGAMEGDPEYGIQVFKGDVRMADREGDVMKVGEVKATIVDMDDAKSSLWDLLDTTTELSQYMPLAKRGGGSFIPSVYKKMEVSSAARILVLEWLELLPAVRGHGIGLNVINRLCDTIGRGCDAGIMKPWPLQLRPQEPHTRGTAEENAAEDEWAKQMGYEQMSKNEKVCVKRLVDQYAKAGFSKVTVDKEVFMVRDLFWR